MKRGTGCKDSDRNVNKVRKVWRSNIMDDFIRKGDYFIFDTSGDRQPMKVLENRFNVTGG